MARQLVASNLLRGRDSNWLGSIPGIIRQSGIMRDLTKLLMGPHTWRVGGLSK